MKAQDFEENICSFNVQTIDGKHRSDLGCWVTTDTDADDINFDHYPTFDFGSITDAAEKFLKKARSEILTDYIINHEHVYLVEQGETIEVVTRNANFINKVTSSYQREFSEPIANFDTKEECIDYLDEMVERGEASKS